VLSAALTLAGCGSSAAGSAAVVGDNRIPVSDLQTAVSELSGVGARVAPATALSLLVMAPYVIPAAGKLGVAVSDDDACRLLAQIAKQNASKTVDCASAQFSPSTLLFVRTYFTLRGVAGNSTPESSNAWWSGVVKQVEKAGVRVNPRFGAFDPAVTTDPSTDAWFFVIGPTVPNWLVGSSKTPTPTPSPAPSATPSPSQ